MAKNVSLITFFHCKSRLLTVHETVMEELDSPSSAVALTFSGRKGAGGGGGGRAETRRERNQKRLIQCIDDDWSIQSKCRQVIFRAQVGNR